MELQHIIIDEERLKKAAQAHPERPIFTALKSYDLHELESPLPPPFEELYIWLKWETLFAHYGINRFSKTLTFVPLFFLPLCIAIGRIWWLFFVISILIAFMGALLQQAYQQNFFYERLEDFLKRQSFDIVGNKLIEYLPEAEALKKSCKALQKEIQIVEEQETEIQRMYQKLQHEQATQKQLQRLQKQLDIIQQQQQKYHDILAKTEETQHQIERQKKHVIHDLQIQHMEQNVQNNQRALIMQQLQIPDIQMQLQEIEDIIAKKQIEQDL